LVQEVLLEGNMESAWWDVEVVWVRMTKGQDLRNFLASLISSQTMQHSVTSRQDVVHEFLELFLIDLLNIDLSVLKFLH
jgi:hypothetical protein